MKRLLVVIGLFLLFNTAGIRAQAGRYLRMSHGDVSWYTGISTGINSYRGDEDRSAPNGGYSTMYTGCFNAEIGKWITPKWGFRGQFGLGSLKGWSSGMITSQNPGGVILPAYFQKMNYFDTHVDLVLRPINILKQDDVLGKFSLHLFGGAGIAGCAKSDYVKGGIQPMILAGSSLQYRITDQLSVSGEIRGTVVPDAFDSFEWGFPYEGWGSILFGVSYLMW